MQEVSDCIEASSGGAEPGPALRSTLDIGVDAARRRLGHRARGVLYFVGWWV